HAIETTGFPAILVDLMTRLGYRWYPEYTVYTDFHEYNQYQYHAKVHIFDQMGGDILEHHVFCGIGVSVEMAVHDAAYIAITRLRGAYPHVEESAFRYIPHAPAGDETGSDLTTYTASVRKRNDRSYVAVCAPYVTRRYGARVLMQYTEPLDRAFQALTMELYATCARLYDALTELEPAHHPRVPPMHIRKPSRTELPSGLEWTDVGGRTPALGPQLLEWMRYPHQSHNGTQGPVPTFYHRQLPGFVRPLPR
ncbi:hypothetical protein ZWY2020_039772, partial [Hordeum vulgare]